MHRSKNAARKPFWRAAGPIRNPPTIAHALDADAIASVRDEAWPEVTSTDEMHEALMGLACISENEAQPWSAWLDTLAKSGRATRLQIAEHCLVDAGRTPHVPARRVRRRTDASRAHAARRFRRRLERR